MQSVLLIEAITKYEILMKFQELDETLVIKYAFRIQILVSMKSTTIKLVIHYK